MPRVGGAARSHSWARVCVCVCLVSHVTLTLRQVEKERGAEEAAHYDFFPTTFILPSEYQMFVEEFKRSPQVLNAQE